MKASVHAGFVMVIVSALAGTSGCIVDTRAEYETFEETRPVDDVETLRLELDLGVGRLELLPSESGGPLYEIELRYDRLHYEPDLEFSGAGSTATLRFELDSTGSFPIGDNENELRLRVSPDVVLDLEVSTGVGQSTMEFDDLRVRSLRYEAGVGRTEMSFPTVLADPADFIEVESGIGEFLLHGIGNTRVADFRFEGGVGAAELDFTGDWGPGTTRADVKVGIGELAITVPEDVVVEIDAEDGFLSEVTAPGFTRSNRGYRSGPEPGPARIDMRIESGLGEIRIARD